MDYLSTQCLIDAWSAVRTQQQWGLGCPTNGCPAGTPRLQTLDLTKCWKITCDDASNATFADIAGAVAAWQIVDNVMSGMVEMGVGLREAIQHTQMILRFHNVAPNTLPKGVLSAYTGALDMSFDPDA